MKITRHIFSNNNGIQEIKETKGMTTSTLIKCPLCKGTGITKTEVDKSRSETIIDDHPVAGLMWYCRDCGGNGWRRR